MAGRGRAGRVAASAFTGAAVALVAACGGDSGNRDPLASATAPCPRVGLVAEASDLARYAPGRGRDPAALVLSARLAGFDATCNYAPRPRGAATGAGGLDVALTPRLSVERGPAAAAAGSGRGGGPVEVGVVVAVVAADEGEVLARRSTTVAVPFPPNVSRVSVEGERVTIRIPAATASEAASTRAVLLALALTPEELAANRVGRR